MSLVLNPSPFDGTLRSYVVGAATSIVSRLSLLHAASVSKIAAADQKSSAGAPSPNGLIAPMLEQTVEYVEQILQELIAVFPEPSTDIQGTHAHVGGEGASTEREEGVTGGNSNVLLTPSVLLDERTNIDAMQQASDVGTLKRCIALMKLELVEANVAVQHHREECAALIASHRRRCEGFESMKQELTKEILNLRRTVFRQEPAVMQEHFMTLDIMLLLCGGSSTSAALTDAALKDRMEEVLGIFVCDVDAQKAVSDERFQLSLDRIADLKARLAEADERVARIGKRMQEQDDRAMREKTVMERKLRELRQRITELEQKLQTDKTAWIALERELENVKGDKDALIQAVELAEAKTKQQRQDLYVHIATISQQLLAEQKKYGMTMQAEADPLDVDLVMQIANSGVASDLSEAALERMVAATQRPDDPSKLAVQENLPEHCDNLRKDVKAWKAVALDAGLQLQLKSVEKTDLEEDLLRVIGFSKDNNLPVPMDLIKSRVEAEHINAFDDNVNFKEICRTMRTDAKVASKRLHEIRVRMQTIVPLAQRTAKGDVLTVLDEKNEEKSRMVQNAAAYARGAGGADDERDELGSMLEEVDRTERIEAAMRTLLLDNAKTIRQLTIDKQSAEKSKVQERIAWVDQWVQLLAQLPPQVTEQLNLDGLTALEESPIVLDEFKRIKAEYHEAVEEQKKAFQQHCDEEHKKLQQMAKDVETAKHELAVQEKKLAASGGQGGFGSFRRKSSFGGKGAVEDDAGGAGTEAVGGGSSPMSFALFDGPTEAKKPIETADAEAQCDVPVPVDADTSTRDDVLYARLFSTKEMETTRVHRVERGSQVHVIGTDESTMCELAPKFDRDVANELFASLGQLFQPRERDRSLEPRQSPPRCGSPAFPRRFLCPSCGGSISQVSTAAQQPAKACQTDPLRRQSSSVATTGKTVAPPALKFSHIFEALFPDTLSSDEREFVLRQASRAVQKHHGSVISTVNSEEEGCFQLAQFSSAVDAILCATSLHEYQRELPTHTLGAPSPRMDRVSLSASSSTPRLAATPRPSLDTPPSSDSARRRGAQLHMWPRTRSGISSQSAESAAGVCAHAFAGETVCTNEDAMSSAVSSQVIAGAYSCIRRQLGAAGGSEELWSVVASIHADRRDDWKTLPNVKSSFQAGRSSLLGKQSMTLTSVDATVAPTNVVGVVGEDEWDAVGFETAACGTQTEPVIIISDEEFQSMRGGGSRASTPAGGLGRPSLSASHRPKPSSATIRSRPSTAGIKKLGDSLCTPVRNDLYTEKLMELWCSIDPFIPQELKSAPHRAFTADEVPLVPILSALSALVNLRALIGLKDSEIEQLLKVNCITALQSIFQDLQLSDFTLPTKIPFTVAVRTPGTQHVVSASTAPLLSSTAISDAFRPILHLLSRAVSSGQDSHKGPGLTSLTVLSRPPTPTEISVETSKASNQIHAKLLELETLLKDSLADLRSSSPSVPNVPPLSPPPLLSAYLGWETVPPPAASTHKVFDAEPHGSRSWKTTASEITVYDSADASALLPGHGGRVGRVVVKSAYPTVSIRKGGVVEGLEPEVTGAGGVRARPSGQYPNCAASAMGRQFLKPIAHRHNTTDPPPPPLPTFDAPREVGNDGPTRRGASRARQQSQSRTAVSTPQVARHADSPMRRTLSHLPSELPPVSAVADLFARSFTPSSACQRGTRQHPNE